MKVAGEWSSGTICGNMEMGWRGRARAGPSSAASSASRPASRSMRSLCKASILGTSAQALRALSFFRVILDWHKR